MTASLVANGRRNFQIYARQTHSSDKVLFHLQMEEEAR